MASPDEKQAQMKQQIDSYLRKKDYYDLLGVQKNADDAQIKKAYKKLALRFHPDKNNAKGSKQVFNKVTNAYANLIDPQKKAAYDRYGPEEDRAPQYRPQRHYRQGYNQQDQFQQIFRAFFGGMGGMGGMGPNRYQNNHYQHFTFNMGGPRQQNNQGNGGGISFMYFFVILFVMYILPNLLFSRQQPLFSTNPSSTYKFQLKTTNFQVPYFVRQQYFTENKNGKYTRKIQEEVDAQFVHKLKKQCDMYHYTRGQASAQYAALKQKYRQSCLKLTKLQQKFPTYIRDLFYSF